MGFASGYKSVAGSLTGITEHLIGSFEGIGSGNHCSAFFGTSDVMLTKSYDVFTVGTIACDFGNGLDIRVPVLDEGQVQFQLRQNGVELFRQSIGAPVLYNRLALVDYNGYAGIALFGTDSNMGYIVGFDAQYFEIKPTKTSDEYGDASSVGGYEGGDFDDSSDEIPVPSNPTLGITDVGFVNVYSPSTGGLRGLGEELFPSFEPIPPATEGIVECVATLAENVASGLNTFLTSQLIQYVIDCHIIPVTPMIGGNAHIKIGFKEMTQTAPVVLSDYVTVNCGTLNLREYYGAFADYSATTLKLYLPFVGFVMVEPEFVLNGAITVIYRFNIIDGSFMVYLVSSSSKSKLRDSVIASYSGNCCVHIPITGLNYSNMISGLVGGASGLVGGVVGKSAGAVISSAVDVASTRPTMDSSNAYNSTSSIMGVRTPYFLIERSVAHFSEDYPEEIGIPSNITANLGELSGYTEASMLHLDGIACTDAERSEIASLLAQGVIL